MKDPQRLLNSDRATSFERLLLDSVRREQPSSSLRRKMQQGIGITSSIFGLKAALAAASQVAVVALLATGIADTTREQAAAVLAPAFAAPSAPVVEDPPASTSGTGVSAPAEVPLAAPAAPKVEAAAPIARVQAPGPAAAVPALRDEIRLLDRARQALKQNAPQRALRELARYQERFPRGSFRQEASVLRVEALALSGQGDRASALARDFVAQHPNSPHVDRVQQVTTAPRRTSEAKPR